MQPKPSFHALNNLINNEWKTMITVKAGEDGSVKFRGFKGNYRISWKDKSGKEKSGKDEHKESANVNHLVILIVHIMLLEILRFY